MFHFNLKHWITLPLLVLGMCASGCGCDDPKRQGGDGYRPQAGNSGTVRVSPGAGGGSKATVTPRSSERSVASEGKVVRVRDGDSIVVLRGGIGIEVRLDGIDCPELAQAFGRKAKKFTTGLTFRKAVRLVGKGKDRYDRELAEVFLPDGRSLNRELVAAGLAWWYRKYSTDRTLETLEQTARLARCGLWAEQNPVPPWDFRVSSQRRPDGGR